MNSSRLLAAAAALAGALLAGCASPTPGLAEAPAAATTGLTTTSGPASATPVPDASPSTPVLTATPLVPAQPTGEPLAATATMPPTMLPTITPAPTEPLTPQVISFTVSPTTTFALGEPVAIAWEAVGERAELCPISGTGPVQCQAVPLSGSASLTTNSASAAYGALGLRVSAGDSFIWSTVGVLWCDGRYQWFFEPAPARCPATAPLYSRAAAQYFVRGFMLWVEATDAFYVFHADGQRTFEWLLGPITLIPGGSVDNRVAEAPPAGHFEPVSGFGLVWRGEVEGLPAARQQLGWATAPEFAFDTAYQCQAASHPRLWDCYLRDPNGQVLRLHPDSSAQVFFLWEEW